MNTEPLNIVASIIFLLAIVHTFVAPILVSLAHKIQQRHIKRLIDQGRAGRENQDVSFVAQFVHTCGEIETVFGIWVVPLMLSIVYFKGWGEFVHYVEEKVSFTEPMFVVVIMAAASTRPILNLAENLLRHVAALGKGAAAAWWLTILTLGPLLGSLITEPAAMTIAALLLSKQFYRLRPSKRFEYATLGLLFVNVSVGGTLTNFAAPPVLMVAAPWGWTSTYVLQNVGWKAAVGIVVSNLVYFFIFRKEFRKLDDFKKSHAMKDVEVTSEDQTDLVPAWVKAVHVLGLAWIVVNAHHPALFIGGFLFLLGFMQMTPQHQNKLELRSPLLVGFFLAGLVIHGGFQKWWISPVLGALEENALLFASTFLTAFNDNAAITYLSTLVEDFSDAMKIAVVSGAVAGGGLTIIANAPNPAGASILGKFFKNKTILPLHLAAGALLPTAVMVLCFLFL
jgi:hypothetical protein